MIVRWTRRAESDLFAQCDRIARDDPRLAAQIGFEIFTIVDSLGDFPYRGRSGRVGGTRELVLSRSPWVAVYTISDDAVIILRLLHGAQAYPAPDQ
ncbi:MAG: type II toxin-antitoxin system RelE/ParE family toxin [Alphaproteobacteria bacterium]|nr:type II toxin-antitoxin system RelE/ParE family toxin [Alphaproteobacteria bacterium]